MQTDIINVLSWLNPLFQSINIAGNRKKTTKTVGAHWCMPKDLRENKILSKFNRLGLHGVTASKQLASVTDQIQQADWLTEVEVDKCH